MLINDNKLQLGCNKSKPQQGALKADKRPTLLKQKRV